MKKSILLSILIPVVVTLIHAGSLDAYALKVWGIERPFYTPAQLLSIDVATGTAEIVGSLGENFTDVRAIAWNPLDETLYGVSDINPSGSDYDRLIKIDVTTGTAKFIGSTPHLGFGTITDLAFIQEKLYAINAGGCSNDLLTIDIITGQATLVDHLDLYPRGLAFHSITGLLNGISWPIWVTGFPVSHLFEINPTTGQTAPIGIYSGNITGIQALAFNANHNLLYAAERDVGQIGGNQLVQIDPNTGTRTIIGPFGFDNVSAIALQAEGVALNQPPRL